MITFSNVITQILIMTFLLIYPEQSMIETASFSQSELLENALGKFSHRISE